MSSILILIDGGPASGKNTLGDLLVDKFRTLGTRAVLLDLDTYVEMFNPKWIWDDEVQKEKDQLSARINMTKDIDDYLQKDFAVIVIGERFLTKADVTKFMKRVAARCSILLYHLSVPLALREQRLYQRGPHSLIDLAKDQKDRDAIKDWPGFVYENVHSPETDASNLIALIKQSKGTISL